MFRRALKVGASHMCLLWQRTVRGTTESRAERRVEDRGFGEQTKGWWVLGCLGARFGSYVGRK